MKITFEDVEYEATPESIYRDFSIEVESLEEACAVVKDLDGISDYTFGGDRYIGMVTAKTSIIIVNDSIKVNIVLRKKNDKELLKEELDSLKTTMEEIALTSTNEVTATKIKTALKKEVTLDA